MVFVYIFGFLLFFERNGDFRTRAERRRQCEFFDMSPFY